MRYLKIVNLDMLNSVLIAYAATQAFVDNTETSRFLKNRLV
ncbi:MAG: hypothetical protein OXI63_19905 [Candidatus Poribacteria bacterium]|nr:hypothetical protein [Candidatus Poribacteria bacterium]